MNALLIGTTLVFLASGPPGAPRQDAPSAPRNASPCRARAEYRQFDFWVGEWDVTNAGKTAGTSSIRRLEGDCGLLENWSGAGGYSGKSLNFYNPETGKWNQVWVGSDGSVLELAGELRDGAMRLSGGGKGPDGRPVLHRITWTRLGGDEVRQHWETSADDGASWKTAFDGNYRRRK